MATSQENMQKALELMQRIEDETLRRYTVMCLELLASPELKRDIDRAAMGASATLHEWHKEVSEGLLNAIAVNVTLGAYHMDNKEAYEIYDRVVTALQNDRPFIDAIVHLATYAQFLAPACKREAEFLQEQLAELAKKGRGSTDPTPRD